MILQEKKQDLNESIFLRSCKNDSYKILKDLKIISCHEFLRLFLQDSLKNLTQDHPRSKIFQEIKQVSYKNPARFSSCKILQEILQELVLGSAQARLDFRPTRLGPNQLRPRPFLKAGPAY